MNVPADRGSRRTAGRLALVALLMFGFGFALVPLYDTLCDALGINGRIERTPEIRLPSAASVDARIVRVEFVTTQDPGLAWDFHPLQNTVAATPGTAYTVLFHAHNTGDHAITVQAIPSVTPTRGNKYLMKTQCFCFERQTLQAGESVNMPVVFSIDPALPAQYGTLTLGYALYAVEDDEGQGG